MSDGLFSEFPPFDPQDWAEKVSRDLKGREVSSLDWKMPDGFAMPPLERKDDLKDKVAWKNLFPGESPFLRGGTFQGASQNSWVIGQEVPFADPALARAEVGDTFEHGVHALVLDLARFSPENALLVLQDWDAQSVALHLTDDLQHTPSLDLLLKIISQSGVPAEKITGGLENNPLNRLITGTSSVAEMDNLLPQCVRDFQTIQGKMPWVKAMNIDLSPVSLAGGTQTQQIAWALSQLVEYVEYFQNAGVSAENFFQGIMFTFPVGTHFFPEIAKFRAFRLLLTRVMEAYGVRFSSENPSFIQARTALACLGAHDANTNLLRTTTAAMSAVIGGADMITLAPHDLLAGKSSHLAARMARNIQLILRDESHLGKVIDPAGGSYYLEVMTEKMADAAWSLFQETEKLGGFLVAIKTGWLRSKIMEVVYQQKQEISTRKEVLIGINDFPAQGNGEGFLQAPYLAVNSFRTVGADFEALRKRGEELNQKWEKRMQAALFTFGKAAFRSARSNFASNLLGLAGLEMVENLTPNEPEKALQWLAKTQPEVIVLCSSDEEYLSPGLDFIPQIKTQLPESILIVAGKPAEMDRLTAAGIDHFIYLNQNAVSFLNELLDRLEA
ncbi:MAG: hypothetical protein H6581_14485 [Bacteroidia bacterium]|nr:hypothetical protein [Bacteroidia bacterium]